MLPTHLMTTYSPKKIVHPYCNSILEITTLGNINQYLHFLTKDSSMLDLDYIRIIS